MTTTLELTHAVQQFQGHAHRWRIEEPNGPESIGRCRECGETKVFRNWLDEPPVFGNEPRAA